MQSGMDMSGMRASRAMIGLFLALLLAVFAAPDADAGTRAHGRTKKAALKKNTVKRTVAAAPEWRKKAAKPASPYKLAYRRAGHAPAMAHEPEMDGMDGASGSLDVSSNAAFVLDEANAEVLLDKNANAAMPIASLSKLMTALVVIEAGQDLGEVLEVTDADVDRIKRTSSRLPVGARLSRADMLHIALMSSENRAASALGRHYPGGLEAFVDAMNAKARALDMTATRFVEPTGLSSENVASARDLAKLVAAAYAHPLIAEYSTSDRHAVQAGGQILQYVNSNRLVGTPNWEIALQKTGYIAEAGRCLVMKVKIDSRPVVMVFLNSVGKLTRFTDARRLRDWIVQTATNRPAVQMTQLPGS